MFLRSRLAATVLIVVLLLVPAAPAGAQPTHGPGVDLPLCSYMTQEEAAALVGQPVEPGHTSGPGWLTECVYTAADQLAGVSISIGDFGTTQEAQDSYDLRLFASNVTERLGPAGAVRTNDAQTELLALNGPYVVSVSVLLPAAKPTGADLSPFVTRVFEALGSLP